MSGEKWTTKRCFQAMSSGTEEEKAQAYPILLKRTRALVMATVARQARMEMDAEPTEREKSRTVTFHDFMVAIQRSFSTSSILNAVRPDFGRSRRAEGNPYNHHGLITALAKEAVQDLTREGSIQAVGEASDNPHEFVAASLQQGDSVSRLVGKAERLAREALPSGSARQHKNLARLLTDIHSARGIKSTHDGSLKLTGENWHSAVLVPTKSVYDKRGFVLQKAIIMAVRKSGAVEVFHLKASDRYWRGLRMGKKLSRLEDYSMLGLDQAVQLRRRRSDNPAHAIQAELNGDVLDGIILEAEAQVAIEAADKDSEFTEEARQQAVKAKLCPHHLVVEKMLPKTEVHLPQAEMEVDVKALVAKVSKKAIDSQPSKLHAMFRRDGRRNKVAAWHLGNVLEPAALALARKQRMVTTLEVYNWFSPVDERARTYRRQFATTYPFLVGLVKFNPALTAQIDAGQALVPQLAERLDIKKAVMDRIARQPWQRFAAMHKQAEAFFAGLLGDRMLLQELSSSPVRPHWGPALDILKQMPPEWLPNKVKEWKAFGSLMQAFPADAGRFGAPDNSERDIEGILHHIRRNKGDWTAITASMEGFGQVRDYRRTVLTHILQACLGDDRLLLGAEGQSRCLPFLEGRRMDIVRLCEASKDWHDRSAYWPRIFEAIREMRTDVVKELDADAIHRASNEWLPLTEATYEVPEVGRMTWLTTRAELQAETDAMHHCVWSYGPQCTTGRSHIASVRAADGSRATLELRVERSADGEGWVLHQQQLYGAHNRQASPACQAVVTRFLAEVSRKDSVLVDFDVIEAARRERVSIIGPQKYHYGDVFNAEVPEQCEAILAVYRRYMAKPYREMTLHQLREAAIELYRGPEVEEEPVPVEPALAEPAQPERAPTAAYLQAELEEGFGAEAVLRM